VRASHSHIARIPPIMTLTAETGQNLRVFRLYRYFDSVFPPYHISSIVIVKNEDYNAHKQIWTYV